jgi:hypothetical protein
MSSAGVITLSIVLKASRSVLGTTALGHAGASVGASMQSSHRLAVAASSLRRSTEICTPDISSDVIKWPQNERIAV